MISRPPRTKALGAFIESLWAYRAHHAHEAERLLPSGRFQLLVNLASDELAVRSWLEGKDWMTRSGSGLQGPQSRGVHLDTVQQRHVLGVVFRLAGATPFLRAPAEAFRDRYAELTEVWGPSGRSLRERLLEASTDAGRLDMLEAFLLARLDPARVGPASLERAVRYLAIGPSVGEVCERVGGSRRSLERAFARFIGTTPKQFSRVARLRRASRSLCQNEGPLGGWAEFALAHGYYDQAHLIHEFRSLTGLTPTRYSPRSREEPTHAVLKP